MLYSRKEPIENPVPIPPETLDKSLPLHSCHYRIGPSSEGATVSSSAASLISGAVPSHHDDQGTQHPPLHLWGYSGWCSRSLIGNSRSHSKIRGGLAGHRFSELGSIHSLSSVTTPLLSVLYAGFYPRWFWTKLLKDQKKVWKALR